MTDFISISSKDKGSNDTNSNFSVKFTNPIEDVRAVKISFIEIPQTYYTIMTGINDKFYIKVSTTTYTSTLTEGVYNASNLAAELQSQINTSYPTDNNFTVTVSTLTYKFTVTHSTTSFRVMFATNTSQSSRITFGFSETDTTSATSSVGQNVYNLGYNETIFISSRALSKSSARVNNTKSNVIFPMGCNGNFGEILTFDGTSSDWIIDYGKKKSFDELDFRLVFEDLTTDVPLNGLNWRISLQFIKDDKER